MQTQTGIYWELVENGWGAGFNNECVCRLLNAVSLGKLTHDSLLEYKIVHAHCIYGGADTVYYLLKIESHLLKYT